MSIILIWHFLKLTLIENNRINEALEWLNTFLLLVVLFLEQARE